MGDRAAADHAAEDVSDERSNSGCGGNGRRCMGGIDVVVANAAIEPLHEDGLVHEIDADLFRQVVNVDLVGMFLTCKHGVRDSSAAAGAASS